MAHEYRYPLTRVCLRGGNMTLPRTMIGLFPDGGSVTVVDTLTGDEHEVHMSGPRVVSGLGPLYSTHGLDVNDELLVSQLADDRFAITAVARADEESKATAEPSGTEGEVSGQDAQLAQAEPVADQVAEHEAGSHAGQGSDAARASAPSAGVVREERRFAKPGEPTTEWAGASEEPDPERTSLDPRLAVREAESALSELEKDGLAAGQPDSVGEDGEPDAPGVAAFAGPVEPNEEEPAADGAGADAPGPAEAGGRADQQGTLWEAGADAAPEGGGEQRQAAATEGRSARPARGPAHKDAEEQAAALAAVALSSRLRRTFTRLGYRIEPLTTGVLFLHADLGRRRYKVLVQLLRSGERLDWAGLLARRRESPANYMAVVGDHVDLIRLSHPAELARATLWSWEALARLEELHASVPVTPLDLETHFAHDGLFDKGLKRFEESVTARVAERGAASEVLTRLARNKAPSVFLLEELAQDVNLSRDLVLRILERFSEAPMHLVARVDSGEFLLRQPVDSALASLASYAQSLRQRLPVGRREVVVGLDDEELGAGLLDDVAAHDGETPAAPDQEPVPDQ